MLGLNVLPRFFNIAAIELPNNFLSISMLESDNRYSAEELPIWILNSEIKEFKEFKDRAGVFTITVQGYDIDGAEGEISGLIFTSRK